MNMMHLVPMFSVEIGLLIRKWREQAYLTQADLAGRVRRLGLERVTPSAVARWEGRGLQYFTRGLAYLILILQAIGCSDEEVRQGLHEAVEVVWSRYLRERDGA